jgi:hypothetical protein
VFYVQAKLLDYIIPVCNNILCYIKFAAMPQISRQSNGTPDQQDEDFLIDTNFIENSANNEGIIVVLSDNVKDNESDNLMNDFQPTDRL